MVSPHDLETNENIVDINLAGVILLSTPLANMMIFLVSTDPKSVHSNLLC